DFNREMEVTQLSEAQAQYYLGDLLHHIGRLDAAEAQLQKAISLDPRFAPSYASLGMLKVRQQKHQEALKFLTQAVEADSKDYMAHYYYASMLQTVGDDAGPKESRFQLMKQHLKRSIELAPDYLNAYDMLAYVALALREELPETEELVKKALALSPNRRSLRLRLAELMVANNEAIAARALVTPLMNAEEDSIREQARSLLDGIQKYVDNVKAFEEYQQRRLQAEAAAAAAEALSEKIGDDPLDRPTITRK